jgi:hypothetical protein
MTDKIQNTSKVLLENLVFKQLVEEFPPFLRNPKVHYRVHTSPSLDPVLRWLNPIHITTLNFRHTLISPH